jgi:hypothetical protein
MPILQTEDNWAMLPIVSYARSWVGSDRVNYSLPLAKMASIGRVKRHRPAKMPIMYLRN